MLLAGAAALAFAGPALTKPGNGNGHGWGHAQGMGYGVGGCPPGLAKKGCMPPGQAKKLYRGDHWRGGYGSSYAYRSIPYDLRQRYSLNPYDRYYYSDGYLYRVDPKTMLIEQVISALLYR
jgi:hypothetical protein